MPTKTYSMIQNLKFLVLSFVLARPVFPLKLRHCMEQMQMVIPQPPGFEDDMGMAIEQLVMAMPPSLEFPAGMETNSGFPFPY